jgi:uncharacterized protein YpuA (DUF1002 family)
MRDIIRKILKEQTSEKQRRKVEKTINEILNTIKTDIEENDNPNDYNEDITDWIDSIVKIDVIDLGENERGLVATVNTYSEGLMSHYDFEPIYSEIEFYFKQITSIRLRIKENELIHNKTDHNW